MKKNIKSILIIIGTCVVIVGVAIFILTKTNVINFNFNGNQANYNSNVTSNKKNNDNKYLEDNYISVVSKARPDETVKGLIYDNVIDREYKRDLVDLKTEFIERDNFGRFKHITSFYNRTTRNTYYIGTISYIHPDKTLSIEYYTKMYQYNSTNPYVGKESVIESVKNKLNDKAKILEWGTAINNNYQKNLMATEYDF